MLSQNFGMRNSMVKKVFCKHFSKCGNCQLLNKHYSDTLSLKKNLVNNLFKKNNFQFKVSQLISADENIKYRNKMIISYRYKNGKLFSGFYEENSHRVVDIDNCIMHTDIQNEIFRKLKEIFHNLNIMAYDEDSKNGLLRYVIIREAFFTNEILITIVTASEIFPSRSLVVKKIRSISPKIKTIIQNINPRKTSIVLGEKEQILYGEGFITDKIGNLFFRITSKSFYQVNPYQTLKLYNKVRELAKFKGDEIIVDAYSGVGTIGMILSQDVKEVISVENNKQAVLAGILNAKMNKITNIYFKCDDATHFLQDLEKNKVKLDAIIMDPPRSGSTSDFLKSVLAIKPKKIIYVSCNPETLIRDLNILKKKYDIVTGLCVDMFCWTNHIETVILLSKKERFLCKKL